MFIIFPALGKNFKWLSSGGKSLNLWHLLFAVVA